MDWEAMLNWRNCHAYVLNIFQQSLRRHIGLMPVAFAQRLKRGTTIIDKLTSGRSLDLSTMHDLAGCRLIFDSIDDLELYRLKVHASRAKHKYASEGRYDYIAEPKASGYRGRHDVFEYYVDSTSGKIYNGLCVEIQYRTRVQHAWATAVEISDYIERGRVKFEKGLNPDRERFFVLASELLARTYEGCTGPCPDLTDEALHAELQRVEGVTRVLQRLSVVDVEKTDIPPGKNVVLRFERDRLVVEAFRRQMQAVARRDQIEKDDPFADVVAVQAGTSRELENAFRNYFRDTREFVQLMQDAGLEKADSPEAAFGFYLPPVPQQGDLGFG